MAKDARVAVPRLRWIGAVGLVALVVLAGLAWFLIKDHGKPAQSAAHFGIGAWIEGRHPDLRSVCDKSPGIDTLPSQAAGISAISAIAMPISAVSVQRVSR